MIRGRQRGPFSLRRDADSDVSAMDDATDTKKRPERRLIVDALAETEGRCTRLYQRIFSP